MIDLAPLFELRLRTPRLELRLGSEAEIRALRDLAERGVHPVEEMPFARAWTDRIGEPEFPAEFEAFHRGQHEDWTPVEWHLNLLVWEGVDLVGTQTLFASGFAKRREVGTGSWLGSPYQGRGIGTEMRAAVLELAFCGLGAVAATSGWLEGNRASARVSEKLGYRETGIGTMSPRGVPVPHHDVRLEQEGWRSPVPIEIEGLEPTLPLFGVMPPAT